ncbi:MAG TPA: HutD family protein [Azospirillaceae bacterium]|nr:HutD family protein [Azospirillaceae bacterium]
MRPIRWEEHTVVPWRNGGGTTREIALRTGPGGAVLWRVSRAAIAADGPFSRFPGLDRILVPVAGEGLVLTVEGRERPTPPLAPVAFPGEAEVAARLTAGAVEAFNVMAARGAWTASVEAVRGGRLELAGPGADLLHLTTGESWLREGEAAALDLPGGAAGVLARLRPL